MKILLVHDDCGNIKSAAIAKTQPRLRAGLRPQRGEFVTEVDEPLIGPEQLRQNPRGLSDNFLVDTVNARLAPKHR
jgi:hypothetical protein